MAIECLDNPDSYRTISHLQIVEHNGTLHGVFERYKGEPDYDGICYFKYVLNDLSVGPGKTPTKDLSDYIADVVSKPESRIVGSSKYGSGRLKLLQLDVNKDINILYIPFNNKKVDNECIFYGIIDDKGVYVNCPSAPVNVQGKVAKISTFYRIKDSVVHPVRIYHLERCESDDKIECTVDNEGHWGYTG